MKNLILALCVLSLTAIVGCASVPMGDLAQDAYLKTFTAPAENAGLYVYRDETFGAAIKMLVEINGKLLGTTAAKTFLYTELRPGEYTITSHTENTETLKLEVKEGSLYYIWQEVKMGIISARSKLHAVDEKKGQEGVLKTKLAESASLAE
jgi:hypothetical protein